MVVFRVRFLPVADEFAGWMKTTMPQMTFSREGVQMSNPEPRVLSHPQLGPVFYLDPTKDLPETADYDKAILIITRTKLAYRDPQSQEFRIQDLTSKTDRPGQPSLTLTGDSISLFWRKLSPWLSLATAVVTFISFYVWKLLAALFYSLLGLLLNLFRSERLRYGVVLNLTFFALTPVILLQSLQLIFPAWPVPLNWITGFLVTALYLALALLATQQPASGEDGTAPAPSN